MADVTLYRGLTHLVISLYPCPLLFAIRTTGDARVSHRFLLRVVTSVRPRPAWCVVEPRGRSLVNDSTTHRCGGP